MLFASTKSTFVSEDVQHKPVTHLLSVAAKGTWKWAYRNSDLQERAVQVQQMYRIFHTAQIVVVWLGKKRDEEAEGIPHIEHMARHRVNLPPRDYFASDGRITVPEFLGLDALAAFDAFVSARGLLFSQWFRRTWVVQELCLARRVVFAMNEYEMSLQTVQKGFEIAHALFSDADFAGMSAHRYTSIWFPQIQNGMYMQYPTFST